MLIILYKKRKSTDQTNKLPKPFSLMQNNATLPNHLSRGSQRFSTHRFPSRLLAIVIKMITLNDQVASKCHKKCYTRTYGYK